MADTRNSLTQQQRTEKLLGRLKRRAEEIGYGRLSIEVIIHEGQITQLEISKAAEVWRSD